MIEANVMGARIRMGPLPAMRAPMTTNSRGLTTPVGQLLIRRSGGAQRIESRRPTCVGRRAAVERGKGPDSPAVLTGGLIQWFGAKELEGARERVAKGRWLEARSGLSLLVPFSRLGP
jgi:hypothetical protein